jgi:choline dehydrogenase-like flavoprotein
MDRADAAVVAIERSPSRVNFIDLRDLDDNLTIDADICIVGSGPAGLSIARAFMDSNVQVCIAESGGLGEEAATQDLNEIENVGVPRRMQQDTVRYRIFGGTSHIWTGRCAPFDPIDFQKRPWIPHSGWPITRDELDPYLERAGRDLGLGPHCYDERLWDLLNVSRPTPPLDATCLKPAFWQFSQSEKEPDQPTRFGRHFLSESAPNVRTLLHANVTHINANEAGTRVESVEVRTLEHKRAHINARTIVLCCGGIENARLLLASNRRVPNGVGNHSDTVGRFLMDHPGSVIGSFNPTDLSRLQDRFGNYWLDDQHGRHTYLQGMALSAGIQAKEQLLNCAAYLEEYPAQDDPWEMMRRLRSSVKRESARPSPSVAQSMFWRDEVSPATPTHAYQDALGVLAHFPSIAHGVYRRFVKRRPPIAKNERLDLYAMLEQAPNRDSRVTLSERKDALGMPLSKINWKIGEQEKRTVQRLGQLIHRDFQRLRLPPPAPAAWLSEKEKWEANFTDRAHPMGTTRIAANPKEGVVDANCQVHGVEGLFIAGSSTFPTAGHANPTQMIVAMAIRLAEWLKGNRF